MLIGPSIAEVAALSTRRPLLAVLVALGCPTTHVARVFAGLDVRSPLDKQRSMIGTKWAEFVTGAQEVTNAETEGILRGMSRLVRPVWATGAHLLVLAAIANGVHASVYTDLRTVSGWRCGALFMPLVWFTMGVVEHGFGMIATRIQLWSAPKENCLHTSTTRTCTGVGIASDETTHVISSTGCRSLASTIIGRPGSSSLLTSQLYRRVRPSSPTPLSELIFWVAQASALMHMIFGIFVLSSLVFIAALEGVGVLAQFAGSVVACQVVVQTELAIIRLELDREKRSAAGSGTASVDMSDRGADRGIDVGIPLGDVPQVATQAASRPDNGTVGSSGTSVVSEHPRVCAQGALQNTLDT